MEPENIDLGVFETYPLFGCYYLVGAGVSNILPLDWFGTPGWMEDFAKTKAEGFDPVVKSARKLIARSPWKIDNMPMVGSQGNRSFVDAATIAADLIGAKDF
jgi:hypothetical protein